MDLLGDLGEQDQLTSARSENKVLLEKIQELTQRLHEMSIEKELLLIEVEDLKRQQQQRGLIKHDQSVASTIVASTDTTTSEAFMTSGNGVYPTRLELTLPKLHGSSNPSACALSADETVVATGGADSILSLVAWGAVAYNGPAMATAAAAASESSVGQQALRISCPAPVISIAFSDSLRNVVAAGCMDGSVVVVAYEHAGSGRLTASSTMTAPQKHLKYVRTVAWRREVLATSSADGSIHVYRVTKTLNGDDDTLCMKLIKSLHLASSVEAMAFVGTKHLVVYARGTPHLTYFDTKDDMYTLSHTVNLNASTVGTGGFDGHVSFCILHLVVSHNGKYLAAATDASRNIIFDAVTGQQVRNLYGHQNDGYSQPKVAWSANDQYLLGNTQESGQIVVWDISTTRMVEQQRRDDGGNKLQHTHHHVQPVRDLLCSASDCLVTTSFDKDTKLWFAEEN